MGKSVNQTVFDKSFSLRKKMNSLEDTLSIILNYIESDIASDRNTISSDNLCFEEIRKLHKHIERIERQFQRLNVVYEDIKKYEEYKKEYKKNRLINLGKLLNKNFPVPNMFPTPFNFGTTSSEKSNETSQVPLFEFPNETFFNLHQRKTN